ncbi:hypothetical protein ACWEO2_31565 [Nocardia sp. NPDC004278]
MRIVFVLVLVAWLIVGVVAAGQRGYFGDVSHISRSPADCSGIGTLALTVVAGPLNYTGIHPRVEACELPEPSPS